MYTLGELGTECGFVNCGIVRSCGNPRIFSEAEQFRGLRVTINACVHVATRLFNDGAVEVVDRTAV